MDDLPIEIVRDVLEMSARASLWYARSVLVRISRDVLSWIAPIAFETVTLNEDNKKILAACVGDRLMCLKYVKHLVTSYRDEITDNYAKALSLFTDIDMFSGANTVLSHMRQKYSTFAPRRLFVIRISTPVTPIEPIHLHMADILGFSATCTQNEIIMSMGRVTHVSVTLRWGMVAAALQFFPAVTHLHLRCWSAPSVDPGTCSSVVESILELRFVTWLRIEIFDRAMTPDARTTLLDVLRGSVADPRVRVFLSSVVRWAEKASIDNSRFWTHDCPLIPVQFQPGDVVSQDVSKCDD